ncbi:MAG: hypothetical protein FIA91_05185 [Geobacter sp.]|nr:hypothetical protein [Geobacter sp.]
MYKMYFLMTLTFIMFTSWVVHSGVFLPQEPVTMMSREDLKTKLGSPDLIVIDLRKAKGADGKGQTIMGAVREKPARPKEWAGKYGQEQSLVLFCGCKDDKLSILVAQKLIRKGFRKVYALAGGWQAWLQAGYPTELK